MELLSRDGYRVAGLRGESFDIVHILMEGESWSFNFKYRYITL